MQKTILAGVLVLGGHGALAADTDAVVTFVNQALSPVLSSPATQAAILYSNTLHLAMPESDLVNLDLAWRAEVGRTLTPTISPILESDLAATLRNLTEEHAGVITEIILMDNRGMNVAISHVTSDFWQGDEDKYLMTYPAGVNGLHISDVEFDESTQMYQLQASVTVADASNGSPIGAVTVGLNAEAF